MPRRRPLHRYPAQYFSLFEQAQHAGFQITCESEARARYIRADLYNLRANLRDQVLLDPSNAELSAQYILMENIVIELNANVLHFRKRSYKNEAAIDAALKSSNILQVFEK